MALLAPLAPPLLACAERRLVRPLRVEDDVGKEAREAGLGGDVLELLLGQTRREAVQDGVVAGRSTWMMYVLYRAVEPRGLAGGMPPPQTPSLV